MMLTFGMNILHSRKLKGKKRGKRDGVLIDRRTKGLNTPPPSAAHADHTYPPPLASACMSTYQLISEKEYSLQRKAPFAIIE